LQSDLHVSIPALHVRICCSLPSLDPSVAARVLGHCLTVLHPSDTSPSRSSAYAGHALVAAYSFAPHTTSVGSLLVVLHPSHSTSGTLERFWPLRSRHIALQSGNTLAVWHRLHRSKVLSGIGQTTPAPRLSPLLTLHTSAMLDNPSKLTGPLLEETNFPSWCPAMKARLHQLGVFRIVAGEFKEPEVPNYAVPMLTAGTATVPIAAIPLMREEQALNVQLKSVYECKLNEFKDQQEKAAADILAHL
jgi:hypothetical protein